MDRNNPEKIQLRLCGCTSWSWPLLFECNKNSSLQALFTFWTKIKCAGWKFWQTTFWNIFFIFSRKQNSHYENKKGKRKVQGVPQSQTAALPRPQKEEETDKSKQAQIRLFKYTENFTTKKWKLSDKNSDIFHTFVQRGGSNEYPQSIFWAEIKTIMYPCKPQFYYIKVGFKGSTLYRHVLWWTLHVNCLLDWLHPFFWGKYKTHHINWSTAESSHSTVSVRTS